MRGKYPGFRCLNPMRNQMALSCIHTQSSKKNQVQFINILMTHNTQVSRSPTKLLKLLIKLIKFCNETIFDIVEEIYWHRCKNLRM